MSFVLLLESGGAGKKRKMEESVFLLGIRGLLMHSVFLLVTVRPSKYKAFIFVNDLIIVFF